MKLELKHIAKYLPYQLKVEYGGYGENNMQIMELDSILLNNNDDWDFGFTTQRGEDKDVFSWIKPILRPMSDLIKPCIDGKTPLYELAVIESRVDTFDDNFKLKHQVTEDGINMYGIAFDIGIQNYGEGKYLHVFAYDDITGFGLHERPSETVGFVTNQVKLYEYLYEHHFDIYGLIDKGLAIDINKI